MMTVISQRPTFNIIYTVLFLSIYFLNRCKSYHNYQETKKPEPRKQTTVVDELLKGTFNN